MWNVPREEYEFTRPDGRPAVAPYDFSGKRGIVECSDMGGGKTYQMEQLIFYEHTAREVEWQRKLYEAELGRPPVIIGGCLPGDMKEMLLAFDTRMVSCNGR